MITLELNDLYAVHKYFWDLVDVQAASLHALAREIAIERGVDFDNPEQPHERKLEAIKPAPPPKPTRRYVRSNRFMPRVEERVEILQVREKVGDEVKWVH